MSNDTVQLPSHEMKHLLHDNYTQDHIGTLEEAWDSFQVQPEIAAALYHGETEDDISEAHIERVRQEFHALVAAWGGFYPIHSLLTSDNPPKLRDEHIRLFVGGREILFEDVTLVVNRCDVGEPDLHLRLTHEGLIGDLVNAEGEPTGRTFGLEYDDLAAKCR